MTQTPAISGVSYRPAGNDDLARLIAILNDPPPPETLAILPRMPDVLRAGRMLADAGLSLSLQTTTVAEERGAVVGLCDAGIGRAEGDPSPLVIARLAPALLLRFGPAAFLRALRWMRINPRVQFEPVPGAFHVTELDVAASHRGRGIGGALLDRAEAEARALGCAQMSLTTKITNPARRLYERHGFRVTATKTDAEWERWAQSPGRVLMQKGLR